MILDAGVHHSAAVRLTANACMVWGRIEGGQLGIGPTAQQLKDATLFRQNERQKPAICLRPTVIPDVGYITYVACGTDHTIFIDNAGSAYATRFGLQGQLGLGSNDDVEVARRIKGRVVKDGLLTWADAGGQFSVGAGPAKID